jgi:hypothetical protein
MQQRAFERDDSDGKPDPGDADDHTWWSNNVLRWRQRYVDVEQRER